MEEELRYYMKRRSPRERGMLGVVIVRVLDRSFSLDLYLLISEERGFYLDWAIIYMRASAGFGGKDREVRSLVRLAFDGRVIIDLSFFSSFFASNIICYV